MTMKATAFAEGGDEALDGLGGDDGEDNFDDGELAEAFGGEFRGNDGDSSTGGLLGGGANRVSKEEEDLIGDFEQESGQRHKPQQRRGVGGGGGGAAGERHGSRGGKAELDMSALERELDAKEQGSSASSASIDATSAALAKPRTLAKTAPSTTATSASPSATASTGMKPQPVPPSRASVAPTSPPSSASRSPAAASAGASAGAGVVRSTSPGITAASSTPVVAATPAAVGAKQPASRSIDTAGGSSSNSSSSSSSSSKEAVAATVRGASVPASMEFSTKEAYESLIGQLQRNIEDLNNHIKLLLVSKDPQARQEAVTYLSYRKHREHALEVVLKARAHSRPVPEYQTAKVSLQRERKNEDVEEDTMEVTVMSCLSMKQTMQCFVRLGWDLVDKDKSYSTHTVKGQNVIFNHTVKMPLPPKARATEAVVKEFRRAKLRGELVSKGFLWSSTAGRGEVKLQPLLTQASMKASMRIRDGDENTIGDVAIEVRLHKPMSGREIVREDKELVVLVDPTGGFATAVPHTAAPASLNSANTVAPEADVKATPSSAAAAVVHDVAVPAVSHADVAPRPQALTPAKPKPGTASAPAPTPSTAPAAGAGVAAAAASGASEAKGPLEEEALLRHLGCPAGVHWADVEGCLEIRTNPSNDALEAEVKACDVVIAAAKAQGKTPPAAVVDRKSDAERVLMVLTTAVQYEKLTIEGYVDMVREAIKRDKEVLKALLMLVKHYTSTGQPAEAAEYKQTALKLSKRLEIMQAEVKGAEENLLSG